MGETFILDSSAIVKHLNGSFPESGKVFLDAVTNIESRISATSRIALLSWKPKEDSALSAYYEFVRLSEIIPLTKPIILRTIEVRREYTDAIIAATALALNCTLLADIYLNLLRVPNLKYINPRSLS